MQKAIPYLFLLITIAFVGCHAHESAMGNSCPHGETRKGTLKGNKWTDLRNHQ